LLAVPIGRLIDDVWVRVLVWVTITPYLFLSIAAIVCNVVSWKRTRHALIDAWHRGRELWR
jgi:hypothetical protein